MRENDLTETLRERGDFDSGDAARDGAQATLRTLGERVAAGEAEAVADHLPNDLAGPLLTDGGDADAFSPSEFVDRVDRREEVADGDAETHVRAVLGTLGERVNRREWRDLRAQLPAEYGPLCETLGEVSES